MRLASAAALAVLALSATSIAHADELKANLDINVFGTPGTTSGGTIDFKLNADGTIAATLTGSDAFGLGFNAPDYTQDSGFSATGPQGTSWGTGVGSFNGGWIDVTGSQYSVLTWTVGVAGQFTSVWQALGGSAQYDFFDITRGAGDFYAGNAVAVTSSVPEAPTALLLALGVGALGLTRRRKAAGLAQP